MYPFLGSWDAGPMILCRHLVPFTLSRGTLDGNKRVQPQVRLRKKSKWKEPITTLCFFNALVSLFPLFMPFTPAFHHFPLGSDKEELALVPPFLHAFQGYSIASSHLLFLSHTGPPSSHLSLFPLLPSLYSILSPFLFHLHLSDLTLHSIPTRLPSPPRRVQLQLARHHPEESWHPAVYEFLLKTLSSQHHTFLNCPFYPISFILIL